MKKTKSLFIALAGCAATTLVVAPICTSCGVVDTETDKTIDNVSSTEPYSVSYTFVNFAAPQGVTLEGNARVRAKRGRYFSTIPQPKAIKSGLKFLHWSLTEGGTTPVPANTKVPDSGELTVYPVFQDQTLLKNCVGVAAIETTQIGWAHLGDVGDLANLQYSDDYGENWYDVGSPIILNPGDNLFLRGDNPNGFSFAPNDYTYITFVGGAVNIVGNVMGLLDNASGTATDIPNDYCFYHLFESQEEIRYVSDSFLPATNLTEGCYAGMFTGCSNLVMAPYLPATALAPANAAQFHCYQELFKGCSALKKIKLAYTGEFNDCFTDWVLDVAASGSIVYNGTSSQTGQSAIPTGWTVNPVTTGIEVSCPEAASQLDSKLTADHPYQFQAAVTPSTSSQDVTWTSSDTRIAEVNPQSGVVTGIKEGKCTITAHSTDGSGITGSKEIEVKPVSTSNCMIVSVTGGNTNIIWDYIGEGSVPSFKYSYNGAQWYEMIAASEIPLTTGTATTGTIYIKGNNPHGLTAGNDDTSHAHFGFKKIDSSKAIGSIKLSGTVMGLLDDGRGEIKNLVNDEATDHMNYCFNQLFSNIGEYTSVTSNITSISSSFLPSTTLTEGCYSGMFEYCTGLEATTTSPTTLPALSAQTMTKNCYQSMFQGCSKIKYAPTLSSETLAEGCYRSMFYGCSALTTSPALPATAAQPYCYYMTFQYCYSIKTIGMVSLTSLANYSCFQTFALSDSTTSTSYMDFQNSSSSGWTKFFVRPAITSLTEPTTRMIGSGYYWIETADSQIPSGTWYYRYRG